MEQYRYIRSNRTKNYKKKHNKCFIHIFIVALLPYRYRVLPKGIFCETYMPVLIVSAETIVRSP